MFVASAIIWALGQADDSYFIKTFLSEHNQAARSVHLEGPTSGYMTDFWRLISRIISAFIAGWLILKSYITQYKDRVVFITVMGFLIGFFVHSFLYLKGYYNFGFSLFSVAVVTLQWFLAGLVLAKIRKE